MRMLPATQSEHESVNFNSLFHLLSVVFISIFVSFSSFSSCFFLLLVFWLMFFPLIFIKFIKLAISLIFFNHMLCYAIEVDENRTCNWNAYGELATKMKNYIIHKLLSRSIVMRLLWAYDHLTSLFSPLFSQNDSEKQTRKVETPKFILLYTLWFHFFVCLNLQLFEIFASSMR